MIMSDFSSAEIKETLVRYLSAGRLDEGEEFFKRNSKELSELLFLECAGDISFYRRNFAEAVKFYEAVISLSPGYVVPRYFYMAGVQREREGNLVDAFKYYQAAIDADPSFVDSYVELGALLVKVGDFEGALRCYEDALSLDSRELANYANLKAVLKKLNQEHPGCYQEKLQAAEAAYDQAARSGKEGSLPKNNHW